MARLARVEIFAPDEVAIVHVMNRTVRRCFLFGNDPLTGKNFDHRKSWMEGELKRFASLFGIDLLCYAIMSNHFHLVLRSRPDVVKTWDDTQVARRWMLLCPKRKDANNAPLEPNEFELNTIRNNPAKLAMVRSQLSDISWWMRLLSQRIAQRANREDKETGKFCQARYRAVRLLDETAVLACAAYVDLNPIRAKIAQTLEESDYTSIQKRVHELKSQHGDDHNESPAIAASESLSSSRLTVEHLAPVSIDELRDAVGACLSSGPRASDKGFLPMSVGAYVDLLEWTARQPRRDQGGTTPSKAAPIFARLGISEAMWLDLVHQFGKLFSVVAGKPHVIDATRSRRRSQRYRTPLRTRAIMAGCT